MGDNSQPFNSNQAQFAQSGQPYPAAPVEKSKKKKWPWIVGVVAVLAIFGSLGGGGDTDEDVTATDVADEVVVENEAETSFADEAEAPEVEAVEVVEVAEEEEAPAEQTTDLQMGESTESNGMQVIMSNARFASDYFSSYVCVDVDLTNVSDRAKRFSQFDFELEKPNGVVANSTFSGVEIKNLETAELNPGGNTNGTVCFDGDNTSGQYKAFYKGGLFSTPVTWSVML